MMHPDAMIGARVRWPIAGLLLVAALGAGCAEPEPEPSQIVVHDLGEPYQLQPFAVDPIVIAEARRRCADPQMGMAPAGAGLVVVDARGDNRLLLLFAGPGVDGQCFLRREPNGQLQSEGGGSGMGDIDPAPGPNELIDRGGGSQTSTGIDGKEVSLTYLIGRAGLNIARVEIVLSGGATLQASLNAGWYGLWWPGLETHTSIRGFDAAGRAVSSLPGVP
jgi:hypothetical protein